MGNEETPIFQGISAVLPKLYLGGGREGSRIIDSQCEWGIRIVLLAKNDILYRFLNAQTYRFDSLLSNTKKIAVSTNVETAILVGVTGVDRLLRLRLAYYSLGDPNPYGFRYPPTAFG